MELKNISEKLKKSVSRLYQRADELSGGVLSIFRTAFQRFSEERGSEAAASLAYYAFFSIFPMLLVFIVIGSFFVDREVVQSQLLNSLSGILPGAEEVIIANINRVLQLRGAVTFVALISLVWSSTSVFNILAKNINRAFPRADLPDFFKGRLLGFLMFLGLGLLMLLSFAASSLSGLITAIDLPLNGRDLQETLLWQIGTFLVPVGINLVMFYMMYRWVPMVEVSNKASLLGGLITGVAWELLNNAFTWYLSSGLSQYRLIYGSVGTIVALLLWINLTATIILIGAHLTASIQISMSEKENASLE